MRLYIAETNSITLCLVNEIEITAGVGAFSKAAIPTVTIEGQNVPLGVDGAAHRKMNAGLVGNHTIPCNNQIYRPRMVKYQVIIKH